jgi:hypothetical protein
MPETDTYVGQDYRPDMQVLRSLATTNANRGHGQHRLDSGEGPLMAG